MGFFLNILKLLKREEVSKEALPIPPEAEKLLRFESLAKGILAAENRYIARSDYDQLLVEFSKVHQHFVALRDGGMLIEYCSKFSIDYARAVSILETMENMQATVDKHNAEFIVRAKVDEKNYLDNILRDVDPSISLDDNQREVVLTDEDYCLVIAGAGAGKTTTVAAKIKYLVDKKKVNPKQILVVSFTNKAVEELKDRINKRLSIDCPITTFHAAGNAILRKRSDQKMKIVDSSKLYYVLQDYFRGNLLHNERLLNNMILFFGQYFDSPYEERELISFFNAVATGKYETLKSDLNEFIYELSDARSKKRVTISNEVLRSMEEVTIANYLYLNNIEYQYEPLYPYSIQYARKPYTPDFVIRQNDREAYIEHFGISESGEHSRYSQDELESYKKAINDKVRLHRRHGTTLIYTFSRYNDHRPILEHLREQLEQKGFVLSPRPPREIIEKMVFADQSRYISKLVGLLCRFISNFKTHAFVNEDFSRMAESTNSVRTKLFLDICQSCYLEYQRYLAENDAVDFQDMINQSARILREVREMKQKLDFRYIIVDEYQDISRQRFDLTKELATVTDAKIIAVGDDWQSIYAFSGSDISLFTNFCAIMGYGKLLKIVNTYRNAQEVIDIAGNFVQKNASQIRKSLISPKRITDPVIVYTYDKTLKAVTADRRSGANYAIARAVEVALEQIIEYNKAEIKAGNSSVLLLGRFGFDGDNLEKSGLFQYIARGAKIKSVKYPKMDITFMTVHSAKGLGYDNVIVVNGRNETFGFPSKIEDDPVLKFVVVEDRGIEHAEERRLFYVALTRTKNRVFFIAPEQNPSEFLLEIKRDYKGVVLRGKWNEKQYQAFYRRPCPICGYPLAYRYKNAYGLRLYICMNEPEVCGFLTNELSGKKMSIQKCNSCTDGYLVVKQTTKGSKLPFLGCTNYSYSGKGCSGALTMHTYYAMYRLTEEAIPKDVGVITTEPSDAAKVASNSLDSQSRSSDSLVPETTKEIIEANDISKVLRPENVESPESTASNDRLVTAGESSLERIRFNGLDMVDIIGKILHCVAEVSEQHFFGKNVLLNVLRGSSDKTVLKYQLEQISAYGKLVVLSREELDLIIDWLISNEFLLQRNRLYPVLHPTYNGAHYVEALTNAQLKDLAGLLLRNNPESKFSVQDKSSKKEKVYLVFAGMLWTDEEDKQLLQEVQSGLNISEIAEIHSRSYGAIKARIERLTGRSSQ